MKKGKSILTRCLALVLALVLIVSGANLSVALKASAKSAETNVTLGELVASNYELADWEKTLLNTGWFGKTYSYTTPDAENDLIAINSDTKTIAAKNYEDWTPVSASIMVDNEAVETVAIEGNEATYTYAGEVFSVAVEYELNYEVSVSEQKAVLNAGAYLIEGVEKLAVVKDADSSLEIIEQALPTLVYICDETLATLKFSDAFVNAVKALNGDYAGNDGMLAIRDRNANYKEGAKYLVENVASYEQIVPQTYQNLVAIANDPLTQSATVDQYLQTLDNLDGTNNAAMWRTFKGVLENLIAKLEPAATADWNTQAIQSINCSDYASLDAILAGAGETTKVAYKTALNAAETTIHATKNMKTVLVSVELKVCQGNELVSGGKATRVMLTLPQNATAEQILAAVEKSGIVASAQAAWGEAFSAEHFEASATELPEKLTEDITYIITYAPKSYTVKIDGAEQALPYGYELILPIHKDAELAYDYTVNGEAYMQGQVVTITGNTDIISTEGAAYSYISAYAAIGSSLGNETAYAILASGALNGDEGIYFRAPLAPEMSLADKVLTVEGAIASDYAGLNWVPYTYGTGEFGSQFSGNTVSGYNYRQAQVDYILTLSTISSAEGVEALNTAKAIYAEAQSQTAGMESLLAYYDDIGTLNKSYLDALLGTINGFDFTPGDGANGYNNYDDAANLEMRAYFADIVNALLNTKANYIDRSNNNLMLHTMLTEYKNGGLAYYYKNSAEIINQVSDLAGYLTGLVGDAEKEAALALLLAEMGKSEFIEKIAKLGQAMTDIKANLVATNTAINTSANLNNLVKAVSSDVAPATEREGSPYIVSPKFTVVDESAVVLVTYVYLKGEQVKVVSTTEYDRWTVLTSDMVDDLKEAVWATVEETLGAKESFYNIDTAELNALYNQIGVELTDNLVASINIEPKEYTVKIEGMNDQIITVEDLTIELPQHENHPGTVYEYTVKGETTRATAYTFEMDDLITLFSEGENYTYTIAVDTLEVAQQMLDGALAALNNNTAGNTFEIVDGALVANIAGTGDGLMAFVKGMLDTGYGYIGLNNLPMMYSVEGEGLEVSLQTLIDAMLADETFGSNTLIELGKNNGGKVLSATMQLGIDAQTLYEDAMPFVLNLTSVPEQMGTVATGLDAVKNNLYFKSNGDHVYVYVDLPEKVYEVYLTAMMGLSQLDKTDMNAINNAIAFYFLYDYVELIANTDVTAQSFENTLKIFDDAANAILDKDIPNYDVAAYDKYLTLVKDILNSDGIEVEADETTMTLGLTGQGKHLITLANKLGFNLDAYNTYIGMVKEFKDGNNLSAKGIATLVNTSVDFEAVVVDLNAGIDGAKEIYHIENRNDAIEEAIDMVKGMGLTNAIDYTDDLIARASEITGKAAIMLLDDVNGNLTFNDTTILDLNGKTLNGNLVANGHVYIMDSTLDTANAGSITGSISGNVTIIAGNYNANVASYLPDGYIQVDGNVRNALYTIESPTEDDLIVTINPDVYMETYVDGYMPSIRALAADIVTDLGFNYFMAAKVAVDGNTIYNIDLDNLIGFIKEDTRVSDFINQVLTLVDTEGTSNAINAICADLLDFAAIEQALINGTEIVSYDITVAPYGAELIHVADGDYVSFNLGSMEGHESSFKIALKLEEGVNTDRLIKVVGELAEIVVAENTYVNVFVEQPYYADRTLWLDATAKASLDLDLSKNADYQTIIAVILAYGNSNKAEALVNAIGDSAALKEVFNTITVEEVFNALKALDRNIGFAAMAESLGVDANVENAAAKERVVHLALSGAGYLLEKLDINGYADKTMGMLEEGNSGRYTLSKSASKAGNLTAQEFLYALEGEGSIEELAERLGVEIDYNKVDVYEELIKDKAYHLIVAVSEAYNNSEKAQALVDAIDDYEKLNKLLEAISVEDILNALQKDTNFAEKAMTLNVNIDLSKAAEYEVLARILKAAANYSVDASAAVEHVTLSVKIFADDCLWGDANHDGVVDAMDATLVLQYHVDSLAEGQFFCTKRTDVNGDGAIDAMDATLILQHFVGTITKFPVED